MSTQLLSLQAYDPKNVKLYLGGVRAYGFASDTKITVSRNSDNIMTMTGTDGEASAALSRDRSGVLTLSLQNASGFNDYLSAWQCHRSCMVPNSVGRFSRPYYCIFCEYSTPT